MKFKISACAALLLFVAGIPAWAHHGNAAYNMQGTVTLKGTVTEFDFVNPHAQIYFDVKDRNGSVVHWSCETLSPGKLVRSGWNKDDIKVGDQITITLNAAKSGAPVGFLQKVVLPSGKTLGIQEMPKY